MKNQNNINWQEVPVSRIFKETCKSKANIIINEGGARSTKSISLCQYIIRRCRGASKFKVLVLRKTRVSLRLSTYLDFINLVKQYNIYDEAKHNKSDLVYTFPNNSIVRFSGMDDIAQVKSTGWNCVWLEEANEFNKNDFTFIKTRLSESGENNKILLSYNPEICWIQDLEGKKGVEFIFSNYKDNPFLSKEYAETLESLKDEDDTYYKIYTLGQRAKATNIIYEDYIIHQNYNVYNFRDEFYGLDFGFNNQTALLKLQSNGIESKDIYLTELIYQSHLTTPELICLMKEKIPTEKRSNPIYADSEDPKAIEEIYGAGFNIIPAVKGAGSVREGIIFSKRYDYHTIEDNVNLNKELKSYKWRVDKNGNILDEPVKFRDHLMNAKRYAIFMSRGKSIGVETDIKKIVKEIDDGINAISANGYW